MTSSKGWALWRSASVGLTNSFAMPADAAQQSRFTRAGTFRPSSCARSRRTSVCHRKNSCSTVSIEIHADTGKTGKRDAIRDDPSPEPRGEAAPGAGRIGARKSVAKKRVSAAAGALARNHERHATCRYSRDRMQNRGLFRVSPTADRPNGRPTHLARKVWATEEAGPDEGQLYLPL